MHTKKITLIASLLVKNALSNGSVNHLDITDRAVEGFGNNETKSILLRHKAFLQAGAIFNFISGV